MSTVFTHTTVVTVDAGQTVLHDVAGGGRGQDRWARRRWCCNPIPRQKSMTAVGRRYFLA